MNPSRYALLCAEYRQQRESLLAAFPDIDPETLTDTLDGMTEATDIIALFIRQAREDEAMAEAIGGIMADNRARRERLEMRAQKRRSIARALLNAIGEKKLERPDFTASVRFVPPKVEITDEAALPDSFCKFTRSPDKTKLKDALGRGEAVPGAVLGNGSESLTILTK